MLYKKFLIYSILLALSCFSAARAFADDDEDDGDGIGQTIHIETRFHSFAGKPSWLLIIRDLDHDQNIPYLFDVTRGENTWVAFTYSHHYLITVSNMQFSPYHTYPYRMYPYTSSKINNFCHLESRGHILRNESLYVTLSGDLSPNTGTFHCHVSHYRDADFPIANTA